MCTRLYTFSNCAYDIVARVEKLKKRLVFLENILVDGDVEVALRLVHIFAAVFDQLLQRLGQQHRPVVLIQQPVDAEDDFHLVARNVDFARDGDLDVPFVHFHLHNTGQKQEQLGRAKQIKFL